MNPPNDVALSFSEYGTNVASLLLEMYAEQKITNEYLVGVAMDVRYPEMSIEERDAKYLEVITKQAEYKAKMKLELYESFFLNKKIDDSVNQDQ